MNHSSIIKSAIKVDKFKNLMSVGLSLLSLASPALITLGFMSAMNFLGINSRLESGLLNPLTFTFPVIMVFTQTFLLLGKIIENASLDKNKYIKYINSHAWKNILNLPFIKAVKEQSEKEIVALRLLEEKKSLTDSDYQYLAALLQEKKEIAPLYDLWLKRITEQGVPRKAGFWSDYDVKNAIEAKTKELEGYFKFEQINVSLHNLSKKVDQEKLNSILSSQQESIASKGQLNFTSYYKGLDANSDKALVNLNEYNHSVLSNSSFVELNEKIYKDLSVMIASSNDKALNNSLNVLYSYDWPKVDWVRIKSMLLQGYINNNDYYAAWLKNINVKVSTQQTLQEQSGIELSLEKENDTMIAAPSSILSKTSSSEADNNSPQNKHFCDVPNQTIKYCEYLKYNPHFNAKAWSELKEHYAVVFESKLETHLLLELNSRLVTVLPSIMHADKVLSKNILLEGAVKSAQDLITQNLNMLIGNVKELRQKSDDDLVLGLQTITHYQKMKAGK